MQPNTPSAAPVPASPRRRAATRLRWLAALAVAMAPVLAHPAAAQQRDRGSAVGFRNDVSETRTELPYPPEAVWTVLAQVYAQLHFPLDRAARTDEHEYRTPFMEVRGRLFDRPNADFFACQQFDALANLTSNGQISFAVRSVVSPGANGGTVLSTQVDARARRRGASSTAVECATTGSLEQGLAQTIAQQLAQAAAQAQ